MVEIGDVIKLRPSIFENEFENTEWSDKFMYEDSFKLFKTRSKPIYCHIQIFNLLFIDTT